MLHNPERAALISLAHEYAAAEPAHLAGVVARFQQALPNLDLLERSQWISHLHTAVEKIRDLEAEREHDGNHLARRAAREELPAARDVLQKIAHFALMSDATNALLKARSVA